MHVGNWKKGRRPSWLFGFLLVRTADVPHAPDPLFTRVQPQCHRTWSCSGPGPKIATCSSLCFGPGNPLRAYKAKHVFQMRSLASPGFLLIFPSIHEVLWSQHMYLNRFQGSGFPTEADRPRGQYNPVETRLKRLTAPGAWVSKAPSLCCVPSGGEPVSF